MRLTAGARLGPYEIAGLIGAGGMGEVYRAVDTRLRRAVAIKVLPAGFVDEPDRRRRFEQETRATAALNHPAVLAVYDVGVHEGKPYLVSELLEGTTLRDRLKDGALPVPACIAYGTQIAEGLAVAHDHGITHRDLKPENLFVLPDHRIKILDFGLARLTTAALPSGAELSAAATRQVTLPHTIVGTLGYMAPEQARGEPADHRADIFAFGCVLFEMLDGRRAFAGATPADTISAILKDPAPEMTSSAARPVPPALPLIVQRCLEKQPEARFQSARDLAFVLRSLSGVGERKASAAVPEADPRPSTWQTPRRLAAGVAALIVAGLMAIALIGVAASVTSPFAFLTGRRPVADPIAARAAEFLIPTPAEDQAFAPMGLPGLAPTAPQVGVSPDGRSIALVASAPNGRRTLWVRSLDNSAPRAIARTDGVNSWPFWSPDSRFVVVNIDRALHKIDVTTGDIERLVSLPDPTPPTPFVTGSWQDPDTILFSIGGPNGLYRVAASGGQLQVVTKIDQRRHDNYQSWPQLVRDGRFLTFVRTDDARTTGTYAATLDGGDLTMVLASPSRALYTSGHLLWLMDDRLVAQPFDASSLRVTGRPATIVPSVFRGAGRTPAFWASENGLLVYAAGDSPERQFRWVDRGGHVLGDVGPPGLYISFDLSPDGSRVVAEIARPGATYRSTLSTLDTVRGVLTPLTTGEVNDSDPRFGPGGDIAFARNSGDAPGILRSNPAGGQPSLLLPRGARPVLWMEAWARQGGALVFRSGADRDAWQASSSGDPTPQRLTRATESVDQVQLSPDGRWIVYNSAESRRDEVYLSPVPYDGKRWQLSDAGGVQATWSADGRAVYYLGLDGTLSMVDVRSDGQRVILSAPRRLFRAAIPAISAVVEQYRPTADGQRFLFCLPLTSVQHAPLRVVLNWPARLTPP